MSKALADERALTKDLQEQVSTKTDEIRVLIERMEAYRRHKDAEVAALLQAKKQTEQEIKVMIREHEKQKREAADKLRLLNDLFK